MPTFQKKPDSVEAWLFIEERIPWPDGVVRGRVHGAGDVPHIMIDGRAHVVRSGQWVIRHADGAAQVMNADDFHRTYQLAPDSRPQSTCPLCGNWQHEGLCPSGTGAK